MVGGVFVLIVIHPTVMDDKKKEALQELLRLLADNPDLPDRITITIKPNSKPKQGKQPKD